MDRKTKLEAVSKLVRERRATFEIMQIAEMLDLLLADVKDKLLLATEDMVPRLQGEGAAYAALLRRITRDTPNMTPNRTENING